MATPVEPVSCGESTPLSLYNPSKENTYSGNFETSNDVEGINTESSSFDKISNDDDTARASTLSWIRLWMFFVGCALAGGIIPGQNVYNRLFCEAGLFSYSCRGDNVNDEIDTCCPAQWLLLANTMNALSVTIMFFLFLGGLIFDAIGGQRAAIMGCAINAIGFFVLAALLFTLQYSGAESMSPLVETAIFCIAVILIDAGSIIANLSFFGFLWHLPRHQALVLSLSNSCMNVAALVPLILRFFLRRYYTMVSLPSIIFWYAVSIIGVAIPICWFCVPTVDEYRSRAMEVLGLPIPRRTIHGLSEVVKDVGVAFRILKEHRRLHIFTILVTGIGLVSPLVYMTMTDPLGQEIFRNTQESDDNTEGNAIDADESGEKLATIYNQSSVILGLFIGPTIGIVVDRYKHPLDGIIHLATISTTLLAFTGLFCSVADWIVQTIITAAACFGQITISLFIMRYAIVFAPSNRVGTVNGILFAMSGTAAGPFFILMSVDIAVNHSYVRPNVVLNLIGAAVWAFYLLYLKRTKPFPKSPVFLPEDDRKTAEMFGVGTIEDAAFVAGMSLKEFRRLSSSSKIEDQRILLDVSLTTEVGERVMEVARRRSERVMSIRLSTMQPVALRYPVPSQLSNGNVKGEEFTIRRGYASSAVETLEMSFNGHGGFGGRCEPAVDWLLSPIGSPDNPRRIQAIHSILAPAVHCGELYGSVLEVRVGDTTAASCVCFHPDGLEHGRIFQVGSDRYYCSLYSSGATSTFNREAVGIQTIQRMVGLKQDMRWDKYRKDYGPMFYIAILGVHPNYQGRGYGKKLLNVVAEWAENEGCDCYLECAEANVPIYKKCGYENIWRDDVDVIGETTTISNFGMVRKCKGRSRAKV